MRPAGSEDAIDIVDPLALAGSSEEAWTYALELVDPAAGQSAARWQRDILGTVN